MMSDCGVGGVIAFPLEVNGKIVVELLKDAEISSRVLI
jgi:hypothetical protein